MEAIKASQIIVCVFSWSNGGLTGQAEKAYNALSAATATLAQRHKYPASFPITVENCSMSDPVVGTQNQLAFAAAGFSGSYGVQLYAEYPGGTKAIYWLADNDLGRIIGVNWTEKDVRPYLENLLYARKPGDGSDWLCQLLPFLCNYMPYLYLAGAGVATYKIFENKDKPALQVLWGAGGAYLWKKFFDSGGFSKIFPKEEDPDQQASVQKRLM